MEWYLIVSFFLTNGIRIFLCLCLVAELLNFSKVGRNLAEFSLGGAILITALSPFKLSMFYQIGIEIIFLTGIVFYLFREQTRMSLFLIFFYEIGISLWEFLCSAGLGVLFHSNLFIEKNTIEYAVALWVVRLLMIGIAIFINKKHSLEKRTSFRIGSIIALMGMFGVISLSEQTAISLSDDLITIWLILSLILVMAILFFDLNRHYEMEKEIAHLKSEQAELLERDYQMLNNTYSANAKLFHDFHNHIEVMYGYLMQGKNSNAIQYLEDLRTPIQEITQTGWTGDKAIDYLINSKIAAAEQAHIQTKVNIEFPHHTNIINADLVAILGNLLDNALDASRNAKDDLRFFHLTIRRINNMLIIKVENGCNKAPIIKNNKLQTTKSNKELHGWGLKSARAAAEKYDGTIEVSHSNDIFRAVVTLSFKAV